MDKYRSEITGNLDIFIAQNEDERDGQMIKWQDILISGSIILLQVHCNRRTKEQ
jgi:hypothetical protein